MTRNLYYGAILRQNDIDGMTYCHEIGEWIDTEELIKHYYETGEEVYQKKVCKNPHAMSRQRANKKAPAEWEETMKR